MNKLHIKKARSREKSLRNTQEQAANKGSHKKEKNCNRCGSAEHNSKECRHVKTVCDFCKRRGRLRRVCFKERGMMKQISDNDDSDDGDTDQEVLHIDSQSSRLRDKILCTLMVGGKNIVFEVDTGSPVNIMCLTEANKCFKHDLKIHEPDLELYSYFKTPIDCAGYIWYNLTNVKMYSVRAEERMVAADSVGLGQDVE